MTELPADIRECIVRWRNSPSAMVRELFGVIPDDWQHDALEAFPRSRRLAMKAAAGPGKTAVLSWIGWNFLLTRPHSMIGCTSISGANLKAGLWTEFARWMDRSKGGLLKVLFEQTKSEIFAKEAPMTWRIEARTWAQDANADQIGNSLAGLHADHVMWLLDETGEYPDAILPICEGIFNGEPKEAHIVQAGNPTSTQGPLYRACQIARSLWTVIEITADPDDVKRTPRVSIEVARQQIQQYGRDDPWVRTRILGLFPKSNINALIGPDEIRDAMARRYRPEDIGAASLIFGVDVARFGDDQSVIYPRKGIVAFNPTRLRSADSLQGAGRVSRMWDDHKADAVFVDNTGGFGSGWIDQLRQLGKAPIGVGFANKAHNVGRYANKRAEMYFDLIAWIKEGGALPPDALPLVEELPAMTYTFHRDTLILEPKDLIKTKIGHSPDDADALCFVGSTLVETSTGSRPISSLRVGDGVLTPFGVSRVAKVWESDTTDLTTLVTSDGAKLVGRPAHEVFAYGYGKIRLDALTLTMELSPLSERHLWVSASASFTAARSIGFKTLVGILHPASLSTVRGCCIAASGLNAMDRFLTATKYITRIVTGEIARWITWSSWPLQNTTPCIPQNVANRLRSASTSSDILSLLRRKPRNGMPLQRGLSGIENMESKHGKGASASGRCAFDATDHTGLISRREHGSVPSRASKLRPISATKPMFARALGVARRMSQIVTGRQPVVPVHVATENVPLTRVYNLTLERDNAYYANGILVFNCLTFAEPVQAKTRQQPVKPQQVRNDWNPFAESTSPVASSETYDPYKW